MPLTAEKQIPAKTLPDSSLQTLRKFSAYPKSLQHLLCAETHRQHGSAGQWFSHVQWRTVYVARRRCSRASPFRCLHWQGIGYIKVRDSVLARRWGARHGAVHCAPRGVSNEGSIKSACHIWFDQAMRSHRATLRTLCTQARSGSPRGAATMQPKALLHTPEMIALGDNLRGGTNHEGDLAFALGWRPARSSRVRVCAQEGTGDGE